MTEICTTNIVDSEKVNKINKVLPTALENNRMAELFKAIADPTRLRIIQALAADELCVCEISDLFEISVSAISHQLRLLRNLNLVKFRREGKMVYYSLDDQHVEALIDVAHEHIAENK